MLLVATVAVAVPASAHTCKTVGTRSDAAGCDAHSCPQEGAPHDHWHDTAWWDWSQTDHGCTASCNSGCGGGTDSDPTSKVNARGVVNVPDL